MRILDLYGGVGGTGIGIHEVCQEEFGLEYDYMIVENDEEVIKYHALNCPRSHIYKEDAINWLDKLENFDFIWVSPPCKSHSMAMLFWSNTEKFRQIDKDLFKWIRKTRELKLPAIVVENVVPYYGFKYKPTCMIGRHVFWANFPILPFEVPKRPKAFDYMTKNDWCNYKGIIAATREQARAAVHPAIAGGIFKQFLQPKQKVLL